MLIRPQTTVSLPIGTPIRRSSRMRSRLKVYGGRKPRTLRTIHSFGLRSPSSSSAAQRARASRPALSSALDIQACPPIHPVLEAGPGPSKDAPEVVAVAVVSPQDRLDDELGGSDSDPLREQPRGAEVEAAHVLHVERAVAGTVGE